MLADDHAFRHHVYWSLRQLADSLEEQQLVEQALAEQELADQDLLGLLPHDDTLPYWLAEQELADSLVEQELADVHVYHHVYVQQQQLAEKHQADSLAEQHLADSLAKQELADFPVDVHVYHHVYLQKQQLAEQHQADSLAKQELADSLVQCLDFLVDADAFHHLIRRNSSWRNNWIFVQNVVHLSNKEESFKCSCYFCLR